VGDHVRHNWHFRSSVQLHRTSLPLNSVINLHVTEGATVSGDVMDRNGRVSIPPLSLRGFSALWGSIVPDRIQSRVPGRVEASTGSILHGDITSQVLQLPFGRLFLQALGGSINDEDLFRFSSPSSSGASANDPVRTRLISALSVAGLQGEVCGSNLWSAQGNCLDPVVSLSVFFDIPVLLQNFRERRWEHFDFSGILQGTHGELHHFPLSELPWPAGIHVPQGTADLAWSYDAEHGVTHVSLTDLSADVLDTAHFGNGPVHLEGIVQLSLSRDGMMSITLDRCNFHTTQEMAPSNSNLILSGSVSGSISMHFDSVFRLPQIQRVTLSLQDLHIQTPDQHPLRLSEQVSFSGFLKGRVEFQYDVHNTRQPLYADWDLTSVNHGIENLWQVGRTRVQTHDVVLRGHGGFHWLEGLELPVPNLENFNLVTTGDASLTREGRPPLSISNFNFVIVGQGREDQTEMADVNLTAGSLNVGLFSFVPRLSLRVVEQNEEEHRRIQADGLLGLSSIWDSFEVASDLSFSTDFQHYQWSAILGDVLRAGLLRAQGRIEVEGSGELHGDSEVVNPRWTLRTPQPLSVYLHNRRIASGVSVNGQGRGLSHDLMMDVRDLFHRGEVMLHVGSSGTHSPVTGNYRLKLGRLFSYEGFTLTDVISEGSFSMPSWTGFLSRPEINLMSEITARTEGQVSGPVSVNLTALLRVVPASSLLSLHFRRDRLSNIAWGPLRSLDHPEDYFQGGMRPTGTLNIHSDSGNLSGHSLGVEEGSLYYHHGNQNPSLTRRPLVSNFSFIADRLVGIRRGVAIAGGDGFHYEFSLDQSQFGVGLPENTRPRHVSSSIDRLDLSATGFWRLFKDWLISTQSRPHQGGRP